MVQIITDSASDILQQEAAEYQIEVLPSLSTNCQNNGIKTS